MHCRSQQTLVYDHRVSCGNFMQTTTRNPPLCETDLSKETHHLSLNWDVSHRRTDGIGIIQMPLAGTTPTYPRLEKANPIFQRKVMTRLRGVIERDAKELIQTAIDVRHLREHQRRNFVKDTGNKLVIIYQREGRNGSWLTIFQKGKKGLYSLFCLEF